MSATVVALVGLWVLLGAVWLAVYPFFTKRREMPSEAEIALRDLQAEKARLIGELHELELDYATGKLSPDDYEALNRRLKGRAVRAIEAIEAERPSV